MSHLSIAPITKVVRYARGIMMGGAKHGMRRIAQIRRLTCVMPGHPKDTRVEEPTHAVTTSIDNPLNAMMVIADMKRRRV